MAQRAEHKMSSCAPDGSIHSLGSLGVGLRRITSGLGSSLTFDLGAVWYAEAALCPYWV